MSLDAPTAGLVIGALVVRAVEVTAVLVKGARARTAAVVVLDELLVVRTREVGAGRLRAAVELEGTNGFRTVGFGAGGTEEEVEEAKREATLGASTLAPTLGGAREVRAVLIGALTGGTAGFVSGMRAVVPVVLGFSGAFVPIMEGQRVAHAKSRATDLLRLRPSSWEMLLLVLAHCPL